MLGCDDEITVDLENIDPIVVIDAWLTNDGTRQSIRVQRTQNYFQDGNPPPVTDATVTIADDQGNTFPFVEVQPGFYELQAQPGVPFGEVGRTYTLSVETPEGNFFSQTTMGRVPEIDSVTFRFEEEQDPFLPDGYFGEVWARDFEGVGDSYWIKAWKNDTLLNQPSEINIAFDAGFSAGGVVDGLVFIQPLRDGVNPFIETEDGAEFQFEVPYLFGDSLYVEIHSISNDAFFFLQRVIDETDRPGGFAELFATPLSNVSTNIVSEDPNVQVLGFFNVAAVSAMGRRLADEDDVRIVPE